VVLEKLSSALRDTLRKIATATTVDRDLVKEVVREIQRALLQSDVNVKLVLSLTKRIEERALNEKPPSGMTLRDYMIKIVYEELVSIIGNAREVPLKPQRIMLVGLYGQGKTTTCGKLARYFQKRGLKTGLIASDVHRPAAYDQLKQIAEKVKVPVYGMPGEKKAPKIVRTGLKEFSDFDVVIIDTSGRHSLEDDLIREMKLIANVSKADEKLLVIDATVGQQAGSHARAFHEAIGLTGVIITKLDGTAKGGGALSAVASTRAPIVFIGTGEHMDDLEKFDPPGFISRLLGMGDIKALLERAQGEIDEKQAEKTAKKIMSGRFTLKEMYEQLEMVGKVGTLDKLFEYMPFAPKMPKSNLQVTQERLRKFRIIMDSMTEEEMENPKMVKSSRINRIARGAGVSPGEVKELLRYYNITRKQIKDITSDRKKRRLLMKMMEGGAFK